MGTKNEISDQKWGEGLNVLRFKKMTTIQTTTSIKINYPILYGSQLCMKNNSYLSHSETTIFIAKRIEIVTSEQCRF